MRFVVWSTEYEAEQAQLLARVQKLTRECIEVETHTSRFESFVQAVRKHTEFTALTHSMLHALAEKTDAHAPDKRNGTRVMRIDIITALALEHSTFTMTPILDKREKHLCKTA